MYESCKKTIMDYILYKKPIQMDTLSIVQYCYSLGIDIRPKHCIERNHPTAVCDLPSIRSGNRYYLGESNVIKFYEEITGIDCIVEKAREFKEKNPNYRINDEIKGIFNK